MLLEAIYLAYHSLGKDDLDAARREAYAVQVAGGTDAEISAAWIRRVIDIPRERFHDSVLAALEVSVGQTADVR